MKKNFKNIDEELNAYSAFLDESEYGKTVKQIREACKDYFYTYTGELGMESSELTDYGTMYSWGFNGNELRFAENLLHYLANFDIVLQVGKSADERNSNHNDVAKLLNKLIKLGNEIEARSEAQTKLRYAIHCDLDVMVEGGYTQQQCLDWFAGKDAAEVYELKDGKDVKADEVLMDVVKELLPMHFEGTAIK